MNSQRAVWARRAIALVLATHSVAACGGGNGGPADSSGPIDAVTVSPGSLIPSQAEATVTKGCDTEAIVAGTSALPHQSPDAEKVLPASAGGRPLARWSVTGRCLVDLVIAGKPPGLESALAGIDLSVLALGVAGRSDTHADPPYFVFAARRPQGPGELDAAVALLFGAAGFLDVTSGPDLDRYEAQTIAGKDVHVGKAEMIRQTEHSRGRPYLYQTDAWMFIIITDSDEWAADAIGQLP
jgi:hypothetical protein